MPQKQNRKNFPVQPDAKVACWYGEKEGHMKKAIQRLRAAYPSLIVRCFPGFGHGEIINHPALLCRRWNAFGYYDYEQEAKKMKKEESKQFIRWCIAAAVYEKKHSAHLAG